MYGSVWVLPQPIIFNCFHYNIGINGILIQAGPNHQTAATEFVDHTRGSARSIQDSLYCICVENCLAASGSFQFAYDIFSSFFFADTSHVIVHHNPLAQGFMRALVECAVQPRLPHQEYDSQVPGIH